jgi:flagella basal body P-ring formation protein FlgA
MIRIAVIALGLLLALGAPAGAGSATAAAPRLKELVTVSSDLVRIGDLVENAGPAAATPVFRAPDLGQTGSVAVSRIAEALQPYELKNLDTDGLSEVVVTRLSRPITARIIAERIARAVAGQYGYGEPENLAVILDRDIRVMHVESTALADLAIARMSVEPRTGRFDIAFELPGSAAARRLPLRFTGTVTESVPAATLTRALRAGEIIKASDVSAGRRPKAEVGSEAVTADQAIGQAAKTALRSGAALRSGDLMRPQVVQRNEAVTMFYDVPGIALTVRGKALEGGAIGDMVGVLNPQSNRTIQATVTGPGRVAVGSTAPMIAAAATPDQNDTQTPRIQ